jgi:hypothetical protein
MRPVSLIRDTLIDIRLKMGFESAKAFYRHLSSRRKLEFNYAHYMKIEGAKALPSPAMITAIGATLKPLEADRLTLAYCATLFPNQQKIFKSPSISTAGPAPGAAKNDADVSSLVKQQYLTEAQIASLTRSELHYSLFLVLTLARARKEVFEKDLLSELEPTSGELETALTDLENSKLIRREDGGRVRSTATEMRFPKAETSSIQKLYDRMDAWDREFGKNYGFESLLQKMIIRRVSSRYFGVILGHTQVLLDLIRASEELDTDYNDDVLMLNFNLSRGRLPG